MDKFLIKRKTPNTDDTCDNNGAENLIEESTTPTGSQMEKRRKVTTTSFRKYDKSYIKFGFTATGNEDCPIPQCIVCGEKLSNASMVPNKLQRHLNTKHGSLSNKGVDYFESMLKSQRKESQQLLKRFTVSDKAQLASYKVSEIIATKMKPHTIAETLILPACKEIVKIMLGEDSEQVISKVPLSNNTISRRIDHMSSDIAANVAEKLKDSRKYALQLDESTDISNNCQLLIYMRFVDDGNIIEQFYSCKEMPSTTTGQNIYDVVTSTLENDGISWENCTSVCTDGAPAMTGRFKGFVSIIKREFPHIIGTHCFIHREALMTKNLGSELKNVIDSAVKMVNFIKARPLKTRLFRLLCEEMGSLLMSLLLHTEVRWLSKGKMLSRLFELREELRQFFQSEEKAEFVAQLRDREWCAKLAYLADIFSHLNALNTSMQGKKENILTSNDKIDAFAKKICLWKSQLENKKINTYVPSSC